MNQANVVALLSLVASVLFILALKGLSHPLTARRGNLFGIVGMSMAVVMTLAIAGQIQWALLALAVGGVIGWYVAKRVEMTQMPELVAAMHSLVGLAAVLIAFAVVSNPPAFNIPFPIPRGNRVELFIGTFVGAMTFSGLGHRLRQAGQPREDVPAVLERADRLQGPAHGQPAAGDRDGRARRRCSWSPASMRTGRRSSR